MFELGQPEAGNQPIARTTQAAGLTEALKRAGESRRVGSAIAVDTMALGSDGRHEFRIKFLQPFHQLG
jgi:hypothetical protein